MVASVAKPLPTRGPLQLREAQLQALHPSSASWPVERFTACLRRELPDATRALSDPALHDRVRAELRHGLQRGLRREWDLYRWCRYRVLLGEALDTDPRYAALRRELESDHPHRMDRADYVFYRGSRRGSAPVG